MIPIAATTIATTTIATAVLTRRRRCSSARGRAVGDGRFEAPGENGKHRFVGAEPPFDLGERSAVGLAQHGHTPKSERDLVVRLLGPSMSDGYPVIGPDPHRTHDGRVSIPCRGLRRGCGCARPIGVDPGMAGGGDRITCSVTGRRARVPAIASEAPVRC